MGAPPVGGAAPAGVLGGLFAGAVWMRLNAVLWAAVGSGQTRVELANDLRWLIAAGGLPAGAAVAAVAWLGRAYRGCVTVVRAAVSELRVEGLVVGHPSEGVYVSSTPVVFAERTAVVPHLAGQLGELREQVGELHAEVADLLALLRRDRRAPSAKRWPVSSWERFCLRLTRREATRGQLAGEGAGHRYCPFV